MHKLLRYANLKRATFYYQRKIAGTVEKYVDLKPQILATFNLHQGRMGYRRVADAVQKAGANISCNTVQRLMREMGLKALVRVKRHKSYKGEVGSAAPNLMARDFTAAGSNQKWVTDVTEFKVGDQKLYLSPIMDLFNGEIIAFETDTRPSLKMVLDMWKKATQRLIKGDKPMVHSDQGWQYRMPIYKKMLEETAAVQSMSRKANCYDNAAMESFFAVLKSEYFYLKKFTCVEQLRAGLEHYIHYYNHERTKLKLNGLSPVDYRTQHELA